jgi:hypothetical protein
MKTSFGSILNLQNAQFGIRPKSLLTFFFLLLLITGSSCKEEDTAAVITPPVTGVDMLLIGNSFFKPYANKLDDQATDAGLTDHHGVVITRGGENGRAINFWNDSSSAEHLQIKSVLDQGGLEYFGMTAGSLAEDPTSGFREWIAYALQNNPDIHIFLSVPPIDFPAQWEQRALDNGFQNIEELYAYLLNDLVHQSVVDSLRAEFPSTRIFTIPTGSATLKLVQMHTDGLLLDSIDLTGPAASSLFTDTKGHQGDIITETGSLMWLQSLYGIELSEFSFSTGFQTDLPAIAEELVNAHDPMYK